nr:hypothetical protein [Tanacetum cinerariifolium]
MKGVNALASRLGKPLVTDSVTANKCKQGIGMVRYARVLIEVSAKKPLANDVEIVYKNTEVYKAKKANTEVEDNSEMGDVLEEIGGIAKCMEENVVKGMEKEVLGDCWELWDFQRCVNIIEVEDINSSGLFYTWTKNLHKIKNGGQTRILKKLDRIIGNEDFSNRFCQSYAMFLPYIISDHSPSILVIPNGVQRKRKPFKFANFFTDKDEFKALNVKKLREAVKDIQKKIDKDPNNHDLRSEEANVLKLYTEAMKDEEKILFQKAKVRWLSVGDRNNSYFHKTIKSRQQRNRIDVVCDDNGRRFKGSDVAEQFINKLSSVKAEYMVREVSNEKIKPAMFQIDDNKAPGPDGYYAGFFKKAWNIVVLKIQTPLKVSDFRPIACYNVIYKCISKVLTERLRGCLDKLVSKNQSAFIPNRYIQDNIMLAQELFNGYDRKSCPKRVTVKNVKKLREAVKDIQKKIDKDPNNHDLRSEEANVLKLYTEAMKDEEKILFQKAKVRWLSVGDRNNSYFHKTIKSRQQRNRIDVVCDDNGRRFKGSDVAEQFIKKSCPKRVTVKVDIQKAYNSKLAVFGKYSKMSCRYFKGGRSLRQGDLISPYLFTLVMEILTLIIKRKLDQSRDFQYHLGYKKLKIISACFAHNLLMFCHADKSSVKVVKESIDEFGKIAGLIPNYNKSTIIFWNVDDEEKKAMLEVLPFKVETLPIKYLGVPLTAKRLRAKECKSLFDKVDSRVSSWKNKCLSYASRIINMMAPKEELKWLRRMSERNNRIFKDEIRSPDALYKSLEEIIRMKLMSLTVRNSEAIKKVQEVWNVKLNIIEYADL